LSAVFATSRDRTDVEIALSAAAADGVPPADALGALLPELLLPEPAAPFSRPTAHPASVAAAASAMNPTAHLRLIRTPASRCSARQRCRRRRPLLPALLQPLNEAPLLR
jgi:hypothetical protein